MPSVDISTAGKQLSKLVDNLDEPIELTRYGKTVAWLSAEPPSADEPPLQAVGVPAGPAPAAPPTNVELKQPTDKPLSWADRNAAQAAIDELLRKKK